MKSFQDIIRIVSVSFCDRDYTGIPGDKYLTVEGITSQKIDNGYGDIPCRIIYGTKVVDGRRRIPKIELTAQFFDSKGEPITEQDFYKLIGGFTKYY